MTTEAEARLEIDLRTLRSLSADQLLARAGGAHALGGPIHHGSGSSTAGRRRAGRTGATALPKVTGRRGARAREVQGEWWEVARL